MDTGNFDLKLRQLAKQAETIIPDVVRERVERTLESLPVSTRSGDHAPASHGRRHTWSRLGPKLEFIAAFVLLTALVGIAVYRNLNSSQVPAGADHGSGSHATPDMSLVNPSPSLSEVRKTVSFPVFVPMEVPQGLSPIVHVSREESRTLVRISYLSKAGISELEVLNGPAGCCLDWDPRKSGQTTLIRNGITGHLLINQPRFGGPILWWQEDGAYVALSGPNLTADQLVRIAAAMSSTVDLGPDGQVKPPDRVIIKIEVHDGGIRERPPVSDAEVTFESESGIPYRVTVNADGKAELTVPATPVVTQTGSKRCAGYRVTVAAPGYTTKVIDRVYISPWDGTLYFDLSLSQGEGTSHETDTGDKCLPDQLPSWL